jgi:hypothetical protein
MGLRAAAAARTLPAGMRTPARRYLVVVLALALSLPAGAGFARAADGTAAAKCKRGFVPKKVKGKRKCVRKKAATPSGTINFNGKNAAGGYLRFGIAAGKLSVLSSMAPRKCTLYSDGSVVGDVPNFRYTVGGISGRGAASNSFKVSSSGSFSGEFSTGTLGAGSYGTKLTMSGRSSGGKVTGSFRILSSFPTNGCDSGLVKF